MKSSPDPVAAPKLERSFFLILLALLTVAFAAVLLAVLRRGVLGQRARPHVPAAVPQVPRAACAAGSNLAALATLSVILLIVILPLALVGVSLVQEVTAPVRASSPARSTSAATSRRSSPPCRRGRPACSSALGVDDLAGAAGQARSPASRSAARRSPAAPSTSASDALDLIVGFCIAMYLLFFLLRDGAARRARRSAPRSRSPPSRRRACSSASPP